MAAGLGFFGAEGRTERVDLAESHGDGFSVELAALREIGFLVVDVVDFEKGGRALAGSWGEHGRVRKRVTLAVHELACGADGFGANAEYGGLARRANPEVALIEQEIDAVLFQLDRERLALWNFLHDLNFADADFVAAGGALFRADFAGDNDAGLLRQAFQRFERFGIFLLRADPLDDACSISENREEQFARFTQVVEPALECDFLAVVLACLLDRDRRHGEVIC